MKEREIFKFNMLHGSEIELSVFDDKLLFIHGEYLSQQFDLENLHLGVGVDPHGVPELHIADLTTQFYQRIRFSHTIAKHAARLFDHLQTLEVGVLTCVNPAIFSLDDDKAKENANKFLLRSKTNELSYIIAMGDKALIISSSDGDLTTTYTLDKVGINALEQPNHSTKLELHARGNATYQSLLYSQDEYQFLRVYFKDLRYPMPETTMMNLDA